ncbi:hypothetical protein [Roseateles chitosanitabidus]|jgi:hypothetical protein|nr:hypothetical protein [Roseateles chitosanitabidus]
MIKPSIHAKHVPPMAVGLKAVAVVAVAWGAVYPALLWGLGALLP